mgnify:FL=1|jgi:hypothetical protein
MYKLSTETLQLIADVAYLRAKLGEDNLNISEIINLVNNDENEYNI